jgi:hypothetical protein
MIKYYTINKRNIDKYHIIDKLLLFKIDDKDLNVYFYSNRNNKLGDDDITFDCVLPCKEYCKGAIIGKRSSYPYNKFTKQYICSCMIEEISEIDAFKMITNGGKLYD